MQYKYRWYYAVSICFGLFLAGFFYNAQPRWAEVTALYERQQQLQQQLSSLRQFVNQYTMQSNRTSPSLDVDGSVKPVYWADLFTMAYENGLVIQSFNVLPQSLGVINFQKVHLVMRGDFLQMTGFLSAMTRQRNLIVMTDFSYKLQQQNKFVMNMDVVLGQNKLPPLLPIRILNDTVSVHNPFCFTANEVMQKNDIDELQRTPLAQIKMIGYLQQTSRVRAIVAVPSGAVFDIGLNSNLGAEHGLVVNIQRNYLGVKVNGKEQRIIKMGNI